MCYRLPTLAAAPPSAIWAGARGEDPEEEVEEGLRGRVFAGEGDARGDLARGGDIGTQGEVCAEQSKRLTQEMSSQARKSELGHSDITSAQTERLRNELNSGDKTMTSLYRNAGSSVSL